MLNKHNLEIANLVSSEQSRFALNGIRITPAETAVTDGHCCLRVETPKGDIENCPITSGFTPVSDFEPFNLPKKAALELAKNIPNDKTIPALNYALIGAGDDSTAEFAVNDLEMPKVFRPRKEVGTFPDLDVVVPRSEPVAELYYNLDMLIPLLQQVQKAQGAAKSHPVLISFYTKDRPIRIDAVNENTGQRILAVAMPMRGELTRHYPLVDGVPATPEDATVTEVAPVPESVEHTDTHAPSYVS